MTTEEKIEILAEAMDVEVNELNLEDNLTQNPAWDSLSVLSFIVSVTKKFGKKLKPKDIQAIVTVRDALNLME